MSRRNRSIFRSILAGMTPACFGLAVFLGLFALFAWSGEAQAATGAIIDGEIDFITVNDVNDHWSGGTIVVGGQIVIIPRNLLMDLPANRLTLQEFIAQAPPACLPLQQSGVARGDSPLCNTAGTAGYALIHANRTSAGNVIAGDVFIEKGRESIQGTVTYINYDEGYFRMNGNPGDATTGIMVRLNDPDGRHTVQSGAGCLPGSSNCSADPRYTLDPDNYTNVYTTGYPVCLPSRTSRTFVDLLDLNTNNNVTETLVAQAAADGSGDLLCPTTNRTVSGGQPVDDSRRFAPIMLGDSLTADGNFEKVNGVRFLSAHSMMVSKALTTKDLPDQPDYMFLNEVEIDVPGFQNDRIRTLIIGFASLAPEDVLIWSLHYDPTTNQAHELPLATVQGCEAAGGPGTCAAQGIPNPGAVTNIFKIRHDIDFLVGADPKLNPCSHLQAEPRFGVTPCSGGIGLANMMGILSPIPHEIQARTGHELAHPGMKTLDINGNEAAHGQYLFPFGVGLGGISTPEFDEINLDLLNHPLMFSGIPWNLDRRLSPGGCDGPCEGTPQPLDPFPFEGLDPRTQANLPTGVYSDPVYTTTPLSSVRNRILSYVEATTGKANGNTTVLAWPPANPGLFPISPTPDVPGDNLPPTISSAPVTTATTGLLYTYDVDATDPNGDVLTYSLDQAPPGMSIIATTGVISWTPTVPQAPAQGVVVRVTDTGGLYDKQAFIINVNGPPSFITSPPLAATVGVPYSYQSFASDPNLPNDVLTYSLVAPFPAGMTIGSTTGLVSWTPTAGQAPSQTVNIRVTDAGGLTATQTFTVTVTAPNVAPVITSTAVLTGTVGVAYSYDVDATDANGDTITYSLVAGFPAGMTISPTTGVISWTPTAAQVGANAVTVRATDPGGLFAAQPFTVTVAAANVAPVITSTAVLTGTVGVAYSYDVNATDANPGDVITYSLTTAPAGMTISPTTGVISWTPTAGQVPSQAVTVRATDLGGLFDAQSFTVTVAPAAGDTVTINNATFIDRAGVATDAWAFSGTGSVPGNLVTVTLDRTGAVIGTATVAATGAWGFSKLPAVVQAIAGDTVTATSSGGGTTNAAVTIVVR